LQHHSRQKGNDSASWYLAAVQKCEPLAAGGVSLGLVVCSGRKRDAILHYHVDADLAVSLAAQPPSHSSVSSPKPRSGSGSGIVALCTHAFVAVAALAIAALIAEFAVLGWSRTQHEILRAHPRGHDMSPDFRGLPGRYLQSAEGLWLHYRHWAPQCAASDDSCCTFCLAGLVSLCESSSSVASRYFQF
jgi:hypothetical protein